MKVMIFSSSAFTIYNFRKELIQDLIANNCKVVAVAPDFTNELRTGIEDFGAECIDIKLSRNGTNPFEDIFAFFSIMKIIDEQKPDIMFSYTAKAIVYGSLAASIKNVKNNYALVSGLGSVFRSSEKKYFIVRKILAWQYRNALSCCDKVFFQNSDDLEYMVNKKIVNAEKTVIVNGSGVNLNRFQPTPLPKNDSFCMIARLLYDKGVMEYCNAAKLVKAKYPKSKFVLVGPIDTNPTAIKDEEIFKFVEEGVIEYTGFVEDVKPFLSDCRVFVLPSYHEGTPRTILEAMAMGRPIITTDAPGCRETVIDGKNGFLVPVKDVQALADKMIWIIENNNVVENMGLESLKIAREKYDVQIVNNKMLTEMGIFDRKKG